MFDDDDDLDDEELDAEGYEDQEAHDESDDVGDFEPGVLPQDVRFAPLGFPPINPNPLSSDLYGHKPFDLSRDIPGVRVDPYQNMFEDRTNPYDAMFSHGSERDNSFGHVAASTPSSYDQNDGNDSSGTETNNDSAQNSDAETRDGATRRRGVLSFGKYVGGYGTTRANCHHFGCKCDEYKGWREGGKRCENCDHLFEEHD